ncbi:MAG: tRNA pseudouridine(55) synthase TruB [Alphaproteobacteria bacterium]|nr:tRNA pseudouridine(55) synthase TruB [Alphaproteobacteria bacterium]
MSRRKRGRKVDGWVILDKPLGMTSTQAVGKVRRAFDAQKAGHAGTLDPLATGVLPIALGEATKTVGYAMDRQKIYRFTLCFGEARNTDDGEGTVIATSDTRPSDAEIEAVLDRFTGVISQIPPKFSAIKVDGARAYDLARDNEEVALKPREVEIHDLVFTDRPDDDHAVFEVTCGKGTYMRALARDIAEALGTVGYVSDLRRIAVGSFTEERAISLDFLQESEDNPPLETYLLPIETALDDIPALALTDLEAGQMRSGQAVSLFRAADLARIGDLYDGDVVLATSAGQPVAISRFSRGSLQPVRVLNL